MWTGWMPVRRPPISRSLRQVGGRVWEGAIGGVCGGVRWEGCAAAGSGAAPRHCAVLRTQQTDAAALARGWRVETGGDEVGAHPRSCSAITTSSNDALPARSPMPLMVTSSWRAPPMAAAGGEKQVGEGSKGLRSRRIWQVQVIGAGSCRPSA